MFNLTEKANQRLKKAHDLFVLTGLFFGFVFFIATPFQLYAVYQGQDAERIDVEVTYSGVYHVKDDCELELEFSPINSDAEILIKDARPGDFATCGSDKRTAKRYKKGEFSVIYLTSDGDFYVERGSYLQAVTPLFFSISVYLYVFVFLRKKEQKEKANNNA
ncbi:hypothetical protein HR060_04855 [Catenovulum sp. SM1970]|uniref:hypothetical protein n=1 Tax=Marinifaba aquimaris TaxID=2741323 RepID=UPI00157381AA|nr:hypothetical protein [Marinifaba aquimaris]NTS76191.1 hypothetical protein [Marinifaba aquimaris]